MQEQKTRMSDKKLRIGDLANELNLKKYVIRFWEKEFELSSDRSEGGQRYYTKKDLDLFHSIKDLLYEQGFTIAGAKKKLQEKTPVQTKITESTEKIVGATKDQEVSSEKNKQFLANLQKFKKELIAFKDLLG